MLTCQERYNNTDSSTHRSQLPAIACARFSVVLSLIWHYIRASRHKIPAFLQNNSDNPQFQLFETLNLGQSATARDYAKHSEELPLAAFGGRWSNLAGGSGKGAWPFSSFSGCQWTMCWEADSGPEACESNHIRSLSTFEHMSCQDLYLVAQPEPGQPVCKRVCSLIMKCPMVSLGM